MNALEPQSFWRETAPPVRQYYEDQAFRVLSTLRRRKRSLILLSAVAWTLALLIMPLIGSRYTAEVVIQPRLTRGDQQPPSGITVPSPAVAIDAASLVETEVRLLRTRAMAQRVVARLDLANDPAFAMADPILIRALDYLKSTWSTMRGDHEPATPSRDWLSLMGIRHESSSSSVDGSIASLLLRNVRISNDNRAYLISISYTSRSAELSARIVNAFAEEYLRARSEADARRTLEHLTGIYGSKHPRLAQAQARLDEVLKRTSLHSGAVIAALAEPDAPNSSPSRGVILGFALLGAVAISCALILLRERAINGFHSDAQLAAEAGAPCLGTLPEAKSPADATVAYVESARSVAAAIGIAMSPLAPGGRLDPKVVLLTSALDAEGKTLLSTALARSFVEMGRRVLIVDMSPGRRKAHEKSVKPLEEAINAIGLGLPSLGREPVQRLLVLRRTPGTATVPSLVTSPTFSKLLVEARNLFDVILLVPSPLMLSADALHLAGMADFVLHVVRWNRTPRPTVAAALRRMRNLGIRIDGVVLSRVDPSEHRRHSRMTAHAYRRDGKYLALPVDPAGSPGQDGGQKAA